MAETRTHLGSGLLHLGVKPGATVGLYSVNHTGMPMTSFENALKPTRCSRHCTLWLAEMRLLPHIHMVRCCADVDRLHYASAWIAFLCMRSAACILLHAFFCMLHSHLRKLGCLASPVCTAGWVLVDAACTAYSMTSVPLYDTLGPEAVTYICGHAELTVVACSVDVLDTLLTALPQCPTVKIVVCTSMLHLPTAPKAEACCSTGGIML